MGGGLNPLGEIVNCDKNESVPIGCWFLDWTNDIHAHAVNGQGELVTWSLLGVLESYLRESDINDISGRSECSLSPKLANNILISESSLLM